jgi:hypothetical protein
LFLQQKTAPQEKNRSHVEFRTLTFLAMKASNLLYNKKHSDDGTPPLPDQ